MSKLTTISIQHYIITAVSRREIMGNKLILVNEASISKPDYS